MTRDCHGRHCLSNAVFGTISAFQTPEAAGSLRLRGFAGLRFKLVGRRERRKVAETRDNRFLVEAAEAAAATGDIDGAARLLRELAERQHASLGPDHPWLAHTLNNLGVVHERLAHLDEAEACYRRAYALAVARLPADHPFVETSGQNLREFCAAHGRALESPVAKSPVFAEVVPRRVPDATLPRRAPPPPTAPPRSLRGPLVAAVCVALLVLAATLLARLWSESRAGARATAGDVRPAASPPPPETSAAPAPPAPPPSTPPADVANTRPPTPATASKRPADRASLESGLPAVVDARVCSRLSTAGPRWTCEAVSGSTGTGTLFFYTRLKSARDAIVEHRWYEDERLRRTVELRLSANTGSGYRTFSRQTIPPARTGDWRVELRAKDGTLLGEERFTVQPR